MGNINEISIDLIQSLKYCNEYQFSKIENIFAYIVKNNISIPSVAFFKESDFIKESFLSLFWYFENESYEYCSVYNIEIYKENILWDIAGYDGNMYFGNNNDLDKFFNIFKIIEK